MKCNYRVRFETKFGNESFQTTTKSYSDNNSQIDINLIQYPSTTSMFLLLKLRNDDVVNYMIHKKYISLSKGIYFLVIPVLSTDESPKKERVIIF